MTVHVPLSDLHKVALDYPGMLQDFIQAGELQGDVVAISRERFEELNAHYFKGAKLGTALHYVLRPVVRAVDAALGTHLRDCAGCAGRELKMNA